MKLGDIDYEENQDQVPPHLVGAKRYWRRGEVAAAEPLGENPRTIFFLEGGGDYCNHLRYMQANHFTVLLV